VARTSRRCSFIECLRENCVIGGIDIGHELAQLLELGHDDFALDPQLLG
jgi:hypothetical protein